LAASRLAAKTASAGRETVTTIRQVRAELGLEPERCETPEIAALPDRVAEPRRDHGVERTPIDLGYDR